MGEASPEQGSRALRRQGSEPRRCMGKGVTSRGNSRCKGSEAGVWLVCFNSKETNVE